MLQGFSSVRQIKKEFIFVWLIVKSTFRLDSHNAAIFTKTSVKSAMLYESRRNFDFTINYTKMNPFFNFYSCLHKHMTSLKGLYNAVKTTKKLVEPNETSPAPSRPTEVESSRVHLSTFGS